MDILIAKVHTLSSRSERQSEKDAQLDEMGCSTVHHCRRKKERLRDYRCVHSFCDLMKRHKDNRFEMPSKTNKWALYRACACAFDHKVTLI
jgi:hypothetical protein